MPSGTEDFMMRSKLLGLGLGLALLGGAPAFAGAKSTLPVIINTFSQRAVGVLSDARNSTDSQQTVAIVINTTATSESGYVFFRDATGATALCTTQNPALLTAMKTATSDAAITAYWDASGQCTQINVDNASMYSPKLP